MARHEAMHSFLPEAATGSGGCVIGCPGRYHAANNTLSGRKQAANIPPGKAMKKTDGSPRSERQKATLSGSIGYISEDGFVLGRWRRVAIVRHLPGPLDEAISFLDTEIAECQKRA